MSDKSLSAILEAESHTEETRSFLKQVRRLTRRKFTLEEKIPIKKARSLANYSKGIWRGHCVEVEES